MRHLDRPGWGQKEVKKERTVLGKQVEYLGLVGLNVREVYEA